MELNKIIREIHYNSEYTYNKCGIFYTLLRRNIILSLADSSVCVKAHLKSQLSQLLFFFNGLSAARLQMRRSRTFATAIFLALKLFTADVRGPSSRRQLLDGSMMDAGFYQFPEITGRSEQWSIARATWKMKGRATNCERTNKFVSLSRAPYVRRASGGGKKNMTP